MGLLLAIDHLDEVAGGQAKHLDGMPRLGLVQRESRGYVRLIETIHLLKLLKKKDLFLPFIIKLFKKQWSLIALVKSISNT